MISGFDPIIAKMPKVLILGSMPSITSLDTQEYYGFKHNRFWKIMSEYFKEEFTTYTDKINCIQQHHIILWDVIHQCERVGSLDSQIKAVQVNDIDTLLLKYTSIRYVICNGNKSYALFQKHFSHLPVQCFALPSTSNANRSISEKDLFQKWFDALNVILL